MRKYTDVEEQAARTRARVREWLRAGLLHAPQAERLEAELADDLRRTNVYLRATLAFFTLLIVAASVGFILSALKVRDDFGIAVVMAIAAVACIVAAEAAIGAFRLYRFGVEEMLAACGVALLSFSASQLARSVLPSAAPVIVGLCVAAAGGLGLYLRFGFVWAALGGICCLAVMPFEVAGSPTIHRALSAALVGVVFGVTRMKKTHYADEWPGDEYGVLQAASLAGVYLVINVHVLSWDRYGFFSRQDALTGWFYWMTWALTWILPAAGLVLGLREKDRPLIVVSLAMSIVTLATNKPYLGWERHSWDPMLLGALLIGTALALRRWLSRGPDGARYGYTAARVTAVRDPLLTVLSAAPFPVQPHAPAGAAPPAGFDGGRSGGGGASGSF